MNKHGYTLESIPLNEHIERIVERRDRVWCEAFWHWYAEDINAILTGETRVVRPFYAEEIKLVVIEATNNTPDTHIGDAF